jgi:FG-GAP repeat protein
MATYTQRGSLVNVASGLSVALSGDGLVMAAHGAGTFVRIYDKSGTAWVQRGSALGTSSEGYGTSVALNSDGTVLVVGAPNYSTNRGRVYIYDWSGSAWVLRGTLTPSDAATYDYFGVGVAISQDGMVLAVGAEGWESGSSTSIGGGCVYIYDKSGSSWTQRGSVLEAGTPTNGVYFGHAVALNTDGTTLIVGAMYAGTGGAVDTFDYSGSAWSQRGSRLTPADAGGGDQFGAGVALSADGNVLFVGANLWEGGTSNQGGVYRFDRAGSAWTQDGAVVTSPGVGSNFQFGISVAVDSSGAVLAVRQYNDATNGGTYTYDVVAGYVATGIHSTNFGTPYGVFAQVGAATGIHSITFGTPLLVLDRTEVATGFSSTQFGTPQRHLYGTATGFSSTQFGAPQVSYTPTGFMATRFGIASIPIQASGFIATAFGAATSYTRGKVSGWKATQFGTPTTPFNQAQMTTGFSPTRFGVPMGTAWADTDGIQYCVQRGAQVTRFGTPTMQGSVTGSVTGWSSSAFGTPFGRTVYSAAGIAPAAVFGVPYSYTRVRATGARNTAFGSHSSGRGQPATSLVRPTKFGIPVATLENGHTAYGFSSTRFGRPSGASVFGHPAEGFSSTIFGTPDAAEVYRALAISPGAVFGQPLLLRTPTC